MPDATAAKRQDPAQAPSLMRLDQIVEREEVTRRASKKHVEALKESIAAVGLIQPVAVDAGGNLLAGGHRLAALIALQNDQTERFAEHFPESLVPVRVIALESGAPGARLAFEIELSENEKRRDYTGKEIAALVARFKEARYSTSAAGPRKKGHKQKHLTEALATVLGKSRRQAQRLLSASEPPFKAARKEAATARCLRAMAQALEASAADGSLQQTERALVKGLERKVSELQQQPVVSGAQTDAA